MYLPTCLPTYIAAYISKTCSHDPMIEQKMDDWFS